LKAVYEAKKLECEVESGVNDPQPNGEQGLDEKA
jgi:hypothetical protein